MANKHQSCLEGPPIVTIFGQRAANPLAELGYFYCEFEFLYNAETMAMEHKSAHTLAGSVFGALESMIAPSDDAQLFTEFENIEEFFRLNDQVIFN